VDEDNTPLEQFREGDVTKAICLFLGQVLEFLI
jgi:hypothetical protein